MEKVFIEDQRVARMKRSEIRGGTLTRARPPGFRSASSGLPCYSAVYTRDKLGRIETKTETVEGVETLYEYGYDPAGRLETVRENGILTEQYGYDDNGNRTHLDGNLIGVYDEQDRLASYNGNTYTNTFAIKPHSQVC